MIILKIYFELKYIRIDNIIGLYSIFYMNKIYVLPPFVLTITEMGSIASSDFSAYSDATELIITFNNNIDI